MKAAFKQKPDKGKPRSHCALRTIARIAIAALATLVAAFTLIGCEPAEPDSYVGADGQLQYTGVAKVEGFQHVSPETAAQIIEWGDATIVDVRGTVSYEHEHIPGAIDFMYDSKFKDNAPTVLPDKHATIVVYCDYGGVSKLAAQDLADAGYTNVVEFNGMEVWTGETESGSDPTKNGEQKDEPIPWAQWASGLLLGILFGYAAKRSRFCLTGLVRDVYLEHRAFNLVILLTIISFVGLLYFSMGHAGVIRLPRYLPPFSLLSIAIGSFLFGFGAVMMNGCLVSTLLKCGDGRIVGLLSLAIFMVVGYFFSAGPGNVITGAARSIAIVDDNLIGRMSNMPIVVFEALAIASIVLLARHALNQKPRFTPPASYTGLRHILFEARWSRELMAVAIGLILAVAFPISEAFGRHYGFAVATPVLSWAYTLLNPPVVVGGCNPFDLRIGWASFLVLGIVVGSFVATMAAGEFSIVKPSKKTLPRSIIGSVLMGVGAVMGQGCLISNGLVGTAQLSLKSWYALLFLVAGILLASWVFLKPHTKRA